MGRKHVGAVRYVPWGGGGMQMGSVGVWGDNCLWEVCNLLTVQFIQSLLMSICTYEPAYDFLQDGDALGDSLNSCQ